MDGETIPIVNSSMTSDEDLTAALDTVMDAEAAACPSNPGWVPRKLRVSFFCTPRKQTSSGGPVAQMGPRTPQDPGLQDSGPDGSIRAFRAIHHSIGLGS